MTQLDDLTPPTLADVRIAIEPPGTIKFAGTITSRDPALDLAPFLKNVHSAIVADGLKEVSIDVSALTFVNSSAIRLFVDWATWAKKEPEPNRYLLKFLTDHLITWQKTSFMALKSLAPSVVSVEHAG
jgi:hypothetical protein